MRVLVTDHHLPGETLPAADCIVNPNQPGCTFESKCIAGVGVMFYVMLALRAELRSRGWFAEGSGRSEFNLATLLDLVTLGTVADVVKLDRNNRILVSQGLKRMRDGRMTPGIAALFRAAGRDPMKASGFDLGFMLGPRLNAAGRLSDMALGISRMLNLRLPANFLSPYKATSIIDFWRRWHMSLSTWFRDYLYFPLGGSRCAPWQVARNLFVVFVLFKHLFYRTRIVAGDFITRSARFVELAYPWKQNFLFVVQVHYHIAVVFFHGQIGVKHFL